MSYLYEPVALARLIRSFQPDLIHIEEDPHSLVALEAVVLARTFCPGARISFFIWDNLGHHPVFPLNVAKAVLTRCALSRCALVICGNSDAEALLREAKGYHGNSAVLPQIGVDPCDYPDRDEGVRDNAAPLVGFLGRLVPEKGVILLLEALSELHHLPWRLLVVGSGPLASQLREVWQPRLRQRLMLHGAVPHREVPRYLRALDIFVLPSYSTARWKEQFGLTLVQAMMAGVACIGSSSGAIPEVLGSAGIIFPEGDRRELVRALERLLESAELRRNFGIAARERALHCYSMERVAASYLRVFTSAIAVRGREQCL